MFDEIHTLVGAGAAEGAIDAASILKPMLARGELQTIGATTLDEYRKYLERDAALERRFQQVRVEEPSVDDSVQILRGLRDRYEAHHRVTITDEALKAAAELSDRYIQDRHLPDKAIDLIDEAASRMRIRTSFCDSASVSLKTGMPVHIETMSAISSSPISGCSSSASFRQFSSSSFFFCESFRSLSRSDAAFSNSWASIAASFSERTVSISSSSSR